MLDKILLCFGAFREKMKQKSIILLKALTIDLP